MPTIRVSPGGQVVECGWQQPVLDALEEAGLPWPSDCRAGHCGTCRARCLSGAVDRGLYLPMALPGASLADGGFLPCVATPESEQIEIASPGASGLLPPGVALFPPRRKVAFAVTAKLARTPAIMELRLRPLAGRLRYWPGQFVEVHVPGLPGGRPYSIANRPRPDGLLCLHVSRRPGGTASAWVHDELPVGATVAVSGPYGTFVGSPDLRGPVLCLAGGSGLAPILALTDAALHRGYRDPVLLLFSARTSADLYAQELTGNWRRRHANFRFERTLTRPSRPDPPPHGRIEDVLPGLGLDLADHHVFVAGSPGFVRGARDAALALGADPGRVRVENYFPQGRSPDVAG